MSRLTTHVAARVICYERSGNALPSKGASWYYICGRPRTINGGEMRENNHVIICARLTYRLARESFYARQANVALAHGGGMRRRRVKSSWHLVARRIVSSYVCGAASCTPRNSVCIARPVMAHAQSAALGACTHAAALMLILRLSRQSLM